MKYTKIELAESQLEAAICLLANAEDFYSVITLAGAADVILAQANTNASKKNVTEIFLEKRLYNEFGNKTKSILGREINDTLMINHLKHFDDDESELIEFDPVLCAVAALAKAIANLAILKGQDYRLVLAFRGWVNENRNADMYSYIFLHES